MMAVLDFNTSPVGVALAQFVGHEVASRKAVSREPFERTSSLFESGKLERSESVMLPSHQPSELAFRAALGARYPDWLEDTLDERLARRSRDLPDARSPEGDSDTLVSTQHAVSAALTSFKASLLDSLNQVKHSIGTFVFRFLKWDLTFAILPPKLEVAFGWKCQPMHHCIGGLQNIVGSLAHLANTIRQGAFDFLRALWHSMGNQPHVPTSTTAEDDEPEGVSAERIKLMSVMSMKDSCFEHMRFKGNFKFALSLLGLPSVSHQIQVGTMALSLAKWPTTAFNCMKTIGYFMRRSAQPEILYTREHQCNPHTVGLCLILQKAVTCSAHQNLTFPFTPRIPQYKDNSPKRAAKALCRRFAGVHLNLLNRNGRVSCAANESVAVKLDFVKMCRSVLERVLRFASEEEFKREPETADEAFAKCRRAFGCSLLVREDESSSLEFLRSLDSEKKQRSSLQNEVQSDRSELVLDKFFTHSLWSDGCFTSLQNTEIWEQAGSSPWFFARLANWIGVHEWTNAPTPHSQTVDTVCKSEDFQTIKRDHPSVGDPVAPLPKRHTVRMVVNMLEGGYSRNRSNGGFSQHFRGVPWGGAQVLTLETSPSALDTSWYLTSCEGVRGVSCTDGKMILREFMYILPDEADQNTLMKLCVSAAAFTSWAQGTAKMNDVEYDFAADLLQEGQMRAFIERYGPRDDTRLAILDPYAARDAANKDVTTSGSIYRVREWLRQNGWNIVRSVLDAQSSELLHADQKPTQEDMNRLVEKLRNPYESAFQAGNNVHLEHALVIISGGARTELNVETTVGQHRSTDNFGGFSQIREGIRKKEFNQRYRLGMDTVPCSLATLRFTFESLP
eukprot:TRINITY_DN4011_c1_g5_i1.p1 TRINITY_DN4011_c1_g5~~TRINITY_DN4011_c1_g5_i1.p1  ORF type:complete len:921 (-),score=61.05 TRINITY_DN4011_c1_g5_i1:275-2812(-)